MPEPTFQGGVMLAGWSESHNGGAKVAFWLESSEDLEAFRGLTAAKGKTAGQRFAMVLVEIDDDETPVQEKVATELPKGGALAKLAGILCADAKFRKWLFATRITCAADNFPDEAEQDEEGAAELVRSICQVSTRAELDHNPRAAEFFHEIIRKPWLAFSGGG